MNLVHVCYGLWPFATKFKMSACHLAAHQYQVDCPLLPT